MENLITPLIFANFAVSFLAIWHRNRELVFAGFWGACFTAYCLAFTFGNVIPKIDASPWLQMRIVGEICALFGTLFLSYGLLARFHISISKVPAGMLILVTALALQAIRFSGNDSVQLRTEILVYTCAFLMTGTAFLVWRRRNINASTSERLILCTISIAPILIVGAALWAFYFSGDTLRPESFRASAYFDVLNLVAAFLAISFSTTLFTDIGMQIIARLEMESSTDSLTNLRNRRALERDIAPHFLHPFGAGTPSALFVCDIDKFKSINDRYGHAAGDKVLEGLSSTLRDCIDENAYAGRVGGEEFVVFMPYANEAMARITAEKVRIAFENIAWPDFGRTFKVTASFGVSERLEEECYGDMFHRADKALYRAKTAGRNRVVVATSSGLYGEENTAAAQTA